MIGFVAILGSLGVVALLPVMELVRRALLGRRFEESFDGYRPSIPFDLPFGDGESMPPTDSEVVALHPVARAQELEMDRDGARCSPAAESEARLVGESLDRRLPA